MHTHLEVGVDGAVQPVVGGAGVRRHGARELLELRRPQPGLQRRLGEPPRRARLEVGEERGVGPGHAPGAEEAEQEVARDAAAAVVPVAAVGRERGDEGLEQEALPDPRRRGALRRQQEPPRRRRRDVGEPPGRVVRQHGGEVVAAAIRRRRGRRQHAAEAGFDLMLAMVRANASTSLTTHDAASSQLRRGGVTPMPTAAAATTEEGVSRASGEEAGCFTAAAPCAGDGDGDDGFMGE
ncbi:hypothetical protein OsI_18662 [Oryza sativa Indica Group]|uniref:Uncharacterized protein n=1 Tax=Oryza sativa subsp. indica TaxID=39946 RepID=B8AYM6_ORYSI|nr:hypothetical protein OsI_18662 [Oryza sativa Indica Group]